MRCDMFGCDSRQVSFSRSCVLRRLRYRGHDVLADAVRGGTNKIHSGTLARCSMAGFLGGIQQLTRYGIILSAVQFNYRCHASPSWCVALQIPPCFLPCSPTSPVVFMRVMPLS